MERTVKYIEEQLSSKNRKEKKMRHTMTDWENAIMYLDGELVTREEVIPMSIAWYMAIDCASTKEDLRKMLYMCLLHGKSYVLVIRHIEDKLEWLEKGEDHGKN